MTNPRLNHALSSISHILSHKRTIKKCSFAFREQIHHWWSYYIPVIGSWGKTEGGINILIHGQHSNFLLHWKIIYIYIYIYMYTYFFILSTEISFLKETTISVTFILQIVTELGLGLFKDLVVSELWLDEEKHKFYEVISSHCLYYR